MLKKMLARGTYLDFQNIHLIVKRFIFQLFSLLCHALTGQAIKMKQSLILEIL